MVIAMSDPVTNAEVEDVLSSIRRLVSEDKRPLQGSNPAPAADRLVLTPALRVAQTEEPQQDGDGAADDGAGQDESTVSEASVMDAAGDAQGGDPAEDYSNDPYHFDDLGDEDGEGASVVLQEAPSPQADEAPWSAPSQTDGDDLSAMLDQSGEEQDAGHEDAEHGDASFADEAPMILNAEQSFETSDNVARMQPASKAAVLSAKIEELEAAIGNIADTWEPDGASGDAYAGTEAPAMAWEDENEGADAPAAAHLFKDAKEASSPSDFSKVAGAFKSESSDDAEPEPDQAERQTASDYAWDEQLIDEEMLRDMVSEIVRAELQGALGERITRNVRKLVRREIHRALTAQDLE